MMRIGDMARAVGAKVETVRYYEKIGLLGAPARSAGNYRLYDRDALSRLSFIRRARRLGFAIEDVRRLLGLADDRAAPCDAIDDLVRDQIAAVDARLADLEALRRELVGMLEGCDAETVADCRIVEALAPRGG